MTTTTTFGALMPKFPRTRFVANTLAFHRKQMVAEIRADFKKPKPKHK